MAARRAGLGRVDKGKLGSRQCGQAREGAAGCVGDDRRGGLAGALACWSAAHANLGRWHQAGPSPVARSAGRGGGSERPGL